MKTLDLAELPADPSATDGKEFLGVTNKEMWIACEEYERRMKATKDPHAEFGLRRELIIEVAKEVSERNLIWIKERIDRNRPMDLMKQLHKAPQDKSAQVLRLLRRHGFGRIELCVWVAADMFLKKWVEKMAMDMARQVLGRRGFG